MYVDITDRYVEGVKARFEFRARVGPQNAGVNTWTEGTKANYLLYKGWLLDRNMKFRKERLTPVRAATRQLCNSCVTGGVYLIDPLRAPISLHARVYCTVL